jgi:hypothetical protein
MFGQLLLQTDTDGFVRQHLPAAGKASSKKSHTCPPRPDRERSIKRGWKVEPLTRAHERDRVFLPAIKVNRK